MAVPSLLDKGMHSLSQVFGGLAWEFDYKHASLCIEERLFEREGDAITFLSSLDPGKVCLVFGEYDPIVHLLALSASNVARLGKSALFQSNRFAATDVAKIILKEEYEVPLVPRWDDPLRLNKSERQKIALARNEFERLSFEINVVSGMDLSEDTADLETCLNTRFENSSFKDVTCFVSTLRDFMSSKKQKGSFLEYTSLDEAIFSLSSLARTYEISLVVGVYMDLTGTGFRKEYSYGLAKKFRMGTKPHLVDEIIKIVQPKQLYDDGYITRMSLCE